MRRTLLVLSALLAIGAGPATQPTTQPTHDRDPWVFRCVLDDNPRMLVISLGHHVWAAYDTQHATLAKLWVGDVDFTGAVFDTKHGPQPKARGVQLIERPIRLLDPIFQTVDAERGRLDLSYRGYEIHDGLAAVAFEGEGYSQTETLAVGSVDSDAATVTIRRTVTLQRPNQGRDDGPFAKQQILVPVSPRTKTVRCIDGDGQIQFQGTGWKPVAAQGQPVDLPVPDDRANDIAFRMSNPGTVVLATTYAIAK